MESTHHLFNQLMASNPSEEEVNELFEDLRFIFQNPFDEQISTAMVDRGCNYVELQKGWIQ